jgi:hypothetical protein
VTPNGHLVLAPPSYVVAPVPHGRDRMQDAACRSERRSDGHYNV